MKSEGIQFGFKKMYQNFRVFNWDFKLWYKIWWTGGIQLGF